MPPVPEAPAPPAPPLEAPLDASGDADPSGFPPPGPELLLEHAASPMTKLDVTMRRTIEAMIGVPVLPRDRNTIFSVVLMAAGN